MSCARGNDSLWTSSPGSSAFGDDEQDDASGNGGDSGPWRDMGRPLFFDGEVERADLRFVTGLRIRKTAVGQCGNAGDDQYDCHDLEDGHDHNLRPDPPPVKRRTTKSRMIAPRKATISVPINPPPNPTPASRATYLPMNAPMTPTMMSPMSPNP